MKFKLETQTKKADYFSLAVQLLKTSKMNDLGVADAIGCSVKTVRRARRHLRDEGVLPPIVEKRVKPAVSGSIFARAHALFLFNRISDDQERRQHNEEQDEDTRIRTD